MKVSRLTQPRSDHSLAQGGWRLRPRDIKNGSFPESAALDRMALGVLVVSGGAGILSANRIARDLLDSRDGLSNLSGHLAATAAKEHATLLRLIDATQQDEPGSPTPRSTWIPRSRSGLPLQLIVSPIPVPGSRPTAVLIYLIDPAPAFDQNEPSLARRFRLTPAEARVATLITNGYNGRVAARLLGVSYNTIKTHLKRIYSKTGVDGQGALLRLLLVTPGSVCPTRRALRRQTNATPSLFHHPRG